MKNLLLIEDNEADVLLTKEVFEEIDNTIIIDIARDGAEAIDYLSDVQHAKRKLPQLILLDINLPKKNGFEVLKYIKSIEKLSQIPVVMMTTSSSKYDIEKSIELGADGFFTKCSDLNEFEDMLRDFSTHWLKESASY
jgi:CheY-like chemotaxis protein